MKNAIVLLMIFLTNLGFSQENSSEEDALKTVKDFFVAFQAQDSTALKNLAYENVVVQSVSSDAEGKTLVQNESFENLVKSIVAIPAGTDFEERLHSFDVKVNGKIATVITPYTFYFNGQISHCGVNSFQMVNTEGGWKILYIVDTRIKDDCIE